MKKERADILVVQRGLAESREKAKRMIMAGQIVDQNDERIDKPGQKLPVDSTFRLKGKPFPYVSRGGLKLLKAIETFSTSFEGENVLDIGSSTGGFTDVALRKGASHVYALDVGTNQLHWKLRQDERVTVMEKTNFRYSKPEDFDLGLPTLAVTDVSFISLSLIFPPLKEILVPNGNLIALIKPQFEAGKERVQKHGLVKDPAVHEDVIRKNFEMATSLGYDVLDLTYSPITGGTGNIEYLALYQNSQKEQGKVSATIDIHQVVQASHQQFS